MLVDDAAIRKALRDYLTEKVTLDSAWRFSDASGLIEEGVLDSTGAVELVEFLQEKFSIRIAEEEVTADNLDSIDRLSQFVAAKLQERLGA